MAELNALDLLTLVALGSTDPEHHRELKISVLDYYRRLARNAPDLAVGYRRNPYVAGECERVIEDSVSFLRTRLGIIGDERPAEVLHANLIEQDPVGYAQNLDRGLAYASDRALFSIRIASIRTVADRLFGTMPYQLSVVIQKGDEQYAS